MSSELSFQGPWKQDEICLCLPGRVKFAQHHQKTFSKETTELQGTACVAATECGLMRLRVRAVVSFQSHRGGVAHTNPEIEQQSKPCVNRASRSLSREKLVPFAVAICLSSRHGEKNKYTQKIDVETKRI